MMVLSGPTESALARAQRAEEASAKAETTRMQNKTHDAFLTACMTLYYVLKTEQTPVRSQIDTGE